MNNYYNNINKVILPLHSKAHYFPPGGHVAWPKEKKISGVDTTMKQKDTRVDIKGDKVL